MSRAGERFRDISCDGAQEALLDRQAEGENLAALVEALDVSGVKKVLEVGCGSGALSRELARRLPDDASLAGIDRGARHIDHCRAVAADRGLTNTRYACVDVRDHAGHMAGCYDLVLCRYVLMYALPDQEAERLLRVMARCVAPGGRLCAIEADIRFVSSSYPQPSASLRSVLAQVDRFYRERQLIEWRRGIGLAALFRSAGLADADVRLVDGRIIQGGRPKALVEHDSANLEELMRPVLDGLGQGALLESLASEWRARLTDPAGFHYTPIFLASWTRPADGSAEVAT